jgi:hypothetical protein
MLTSAVEHYRVQQRITAAALVQLRRQRYGPLDTLVRTMAAYQVLAARESVRYFPLMLEEQGLAADLAAQAIPEALAGAASDGRSMRGLLEYTRSREVTEQAFDLIVSTQLQDVARQGSAIAMGARPTVQGYVRMLNAPSCSRCAILAGQFYRRNEGFQRHPRCDCRHVPTTRQNAGGLATEPRQYFDSLTEAEQDRIFTKSGAEAIRLGADPAQVVNARRGMGTSQSGRITRRRGDLVTFEGTGTRAGRARMDLSESGGLRLMPESILERAGNDRAEAIRLLKANGYVA